MFLGWVLSANKQIKLEQQTLKGEKYLVDFLNHQKLKDSENLVILIPLMKKY